MKQLLDKEDVLKEISSSDDVFVTEAEQEYLWERIQMLPTVDAVPVRHGKWKKIRGAINCSACKSSSWSMPFEDLVTSFNYCPNCGARMDEE